MEVILKPTTRCNFACSFCSAAKLESSEHKVVPQVVIDQLNVLKPTTIIITGGEPLMVDPSYYQHLLELGSWNLSFTTNLKDFMLNPNKWEKLFKDKRVSVCTSFQYGNGRKWDNDTVYDEQMFRKTFKQFKDLIGYPLSFIAVIDESNEIYAMKHYELAKLLGTTCKLNALMPLGKSKSFYPMHKIIKIWLDAIDAGYRPQMNMDVCFDGGCNLNTRCLCSSTIRSMMTASDGKLLYSNCEDDLVNNVFIPLDTTQPKAAKQHISLQDAICNNCMFCELFYLCNSCKQLRKMNKYTLDHCSNMLKLKDRIISAGWRLQP